jgi:hypothetical protein
VLPDSKRRHFARLTLSDDLGPLGSHRCTKDNIIDICVGQKEECIHLSCVRRAEVVDSKDMQRDLGAIRRSREKL